MNADSNDKSTLNGLTDLSFDRTLIKLKPIGNLEGVLDSKIYAQIAHTYTSYRVFSLKDHNAILKVISLSLIEFLYSVCEKPEEFEDSLSQFAPLSYMAECQTNMTIKYNEFELKQMRTEFGKEIYKYKHHQRDFLIDPTFLYLILYKETRLTQFLVLMARGVLLEFLTKSSKEREIFLDYVKVSKNILSTVVSNYLEDFNINSQIFLDPLCVLFGRTVKVIYPTRTIDQSFPKFMKTNSTFLETIMIDETSLYWLSTIESKEPIEKVKLTVNGSIKSEENKLNSPNKVSIPGAHTKFSGKKPFEISPIPRPSGDDEGETIFNAEECCKNCSSMLTRCKQIKAFYCERCKIFLCNDCGQFFNQKITCKCKRCLCCFNEFCVPPLIIGLKCQTVCHICLEENDPKTYNIVRYHCGHGICRYCMLRNAIVDKLDPRHCAICNK